MEKGYTLIGALYLPQQASLSLIYLRWKHKVKWFSYLSTNLTSDSVSLIFNQTSNPDRVTPNQTTLPADIEILSLQTWNALIPDICLCNKWRSIIYELMLGLG